MQNGNGETEIASIYNIGSQTFTPFHFDTNAFCAGHSAAQDGSAVIAGIADADSATEVGKDFVRRICLIPTVAFLAGMFTMTHHILTIPDLGFEFRHNGQGQTSVCLAPRYCVIGPVLTNPVPNANFHQSFHMQLGVHQVLTTCCFSGGLTSEDLFWAPYRSLISFPLLIAMLQSAFSPFLCSHSASPQPVIANTC